MTLKPVLIVGSGHLAYRIRKLAGAHGHEVIHRSHDLFHRNDSEESRIDAIARAIENIDLEAMAAVFLVDHRDEHNLELLIALISLDRGIPIVASLFNENFAPHLHAAHRNIQILNPARIAAPVFIQALETPVVRSLRYAPARVLEATAPSHADTLIKRLIASFFALTLAAIAFFHFAEHLSWLNSLYFVVVTIATVGYGDITLLNAGAVSKLMGIGLILVSTAFIWMIFSLTVDSIIKRRAQLSLGRKKYSYTGHVILCGLGRLGYFIAEELIQRGERVVMIEKNEDSPTIEHFRALGADVYIGDARLPRVLRDVGVARAKALFSVTDNDFANIEIGLNARSFEPTLRLVLRIFDESMSQKIKENLDIHLAFSMSAIADLTFFGAIPKAD